MLSNNTGNLICDIWDFVDKTHGIIEDTVDYTDFKRSIDLLLKQGKLLEDASNGLIKVESETLREICESLEKRIDNPAVSTSSLNESASDF